MDVQAKVTHCDIAAADAYYGKGSVVNAGLDECVSGWDNEDCRYVLPDIFAAMLGAAARIERKY